MKTCKQCGETKPLEAFHKQANGRQGRRSRCKDCLRPYWKEYFRLPHRIEKSRDSSRRGYQKRDKVALMAQIAARRKIDPTSHIGKGLRNGLRRRPTENPVTVTDLLEMWRAQQGRCVVSGIKMTWANGRHSPTSISIDRIDPKIGHTKDNVRLVCYQVNLFKSEWTDEDMFSMALAIVTNMRKPKLRLVS